MLLCRPLLSETIDNNPKRLSKLQLGYHLAILLIETLVIFLSDNYHTFVFDFLRVSQVILEIQ